MNQVEKEIQQLIKNIEIKDNKSISLQIDLPETFIGFVGHFENYPILPAVIQMSIGKIAVQLLTEKKLVMSKIPVAKFKKQIMPQEIINVIADITKTEADGIITIATKIYSGEELASTFKTTYTTCN